MNVARAGRVFADSSTTSSTLVKASGRTVRMEAIHTNIKAASIPEMSGQKNQVGYAIFRLKCILIHRHYRQTDTQYIFATI